jgi:serine/threonine protein kinase
MSDPPEPAATGAYQPTPPTAPAGERFAPGDLLAGRYHIVAALGKGGMGEVYRARDSRLDREVALKVLPGAYSTDGERLRRFEQEAQAAGKLNHPNISTVYDVFIHD